MIWTFCQVSVNFEPKGTDVQQERCMFYMVSAVQLALEQTFLFEP